MFTIDTSLVERLGLFLLLWGVIWGFFCVLRVGDSWMWSREIFWALFTLIISGAAFLWFQGYITFV